MICHSSVLVSLFGVVKENVWMKQSTAPAPEVKEALSQAMETDETNKTGVRDEKGSR